MSGAAQQRSVAIIGGGPGGLMAAYRLQQLGGSPCTVTLFEASTRLGGKILTGQFNSLPGASYEAGAAEFYDYSQLGPDPLRALIAELDLPTSPLSGGGALFRGHVLRSSAELRREFGETAAAAHAHFEARARALISPAEYYESDWRADNADPLARQRFDEFLCTVPDETARAYIQMMAHSDVACEPHQTSASYGVQNCLMDEPDYMQLYAIDGGNERLPQELARRSTARVLLGQPVVRVARGPGTTYRVTSQRAGKIATADFDFVIVALPNDCLPAIEWAGDKLPEAMARHHQFYDSPAHYLRVTAVFDRPFWQEKIGGAFFMSDAFGGCCLYDEGARFGADGRGVLGWLIAGEAALRLGNLGDEALVNEAVQSLPASLAAGSARLIEARVHRWAGSVNGRPGGFPAREPDSRHCPEPTLHPGLFVMGDYLFDSTINGVLDSADTVVEWIAESLAPAATTPVVPHPADEKQSTPAALA